MLTVRVAAACVLLASQALAAPYIADTRDSERFAKMGIIAPLPTTTVRPAATPAYNLRPAHTSCPPTVVPAVFGDIQNFAAATSLCSAFLAPTTITELAVVTVTAGVPSFERPPIVLVSAEFPMVTKDPAKASAACSCLIESGRPLTVTATMTETVQPRRTDSDADQFRFVLSAMHDKGAIAVPTLDSRYGKPVRHLN